MQPSRLQQVVSSALGALGVVHESEYAIDCLVVDIALPAERVAVEVQGPTHYFVNDKRREVGHTRFKHRLLRGLGWRVVSVPYLEWNGLRSKLAHAQYLKQLLSIGGP